MEVFYTIPDSRYNAHYSISELGTVRRHYNNGRVDEVRKIIDKDGRMYVRLKYSSTKVYYLDNLLVFTFKNRFHLPLDIVRSIHLDGVIGNNNLSNLEVDTSISELVPYNPSLKEIVF